MDLPLDCRRAVEIWLTIDTQWRSHVAGGRLMFVGLDYAGVDRALAWSETALTPAGFRDLRLMEGAALEALAERS